MFQHCTRRSLLGCGAAAMVPCHGLSAAAPPLFFERIGKPIGLQLYTLSMNIKDFDATFASLAEIGYRDIELPGLYSRTPRALKAAADAAGLRFSALQAMMEPVSWLQSMALDAPLQEIADTAGALGLSQIVVPMMLPPANFKVEPGADRNKAMIAALVDAGPDYWKRGADRLNEQALRLKGQGLSLAFHNHAFEFVPLDNTTGWDILFERTDARLVGFEIDVGWVAGAGHDPADLLKRCTGRLPFLHVKDLKARSSGTILEVTSTEVGSGVQDWARILPAAAAAGVRHYYVEQEPPFAIPRMEAAARSYRFLAQFRT